MTVTFQDEFFWVALHYKIKCLSLSKFVSYDPVLTMSGIIEMLRVEPKKWILAQPRMLYKPKKHLELICHMWGLQ